MNYTHLTEEAVCGLRAVSWTLLAYD